MAVKRYNGSSWDVVAGVGAQGAAATSSSIATWVKTASGGETSVSGNDDSSQPLSYTIGQELVFINGVLQKRGDDYVANTGNSITGLTALTAGDIVSVWTVNAFSVSNAIANTIVDAKGDLLVGTAADTPGRLAVGTDGQFLTAASTTGTGLAWSTLATNSFTLLSTTSLSGTSTVVSNIDQTYTHLYIQVYDINLNTTPNVVYIRPNSLTSGWIGAGVRMRWEDGGTQDVTLQFQNDTEICEDLIRYRSSAGSGSMQTMYIENYASASLAKNAEMTFRYNGTNDTQNNVVRTAGQMFGGYTTTSAITSIQVTSASSFAAGTIRIYGVK